MVDHATVRVVFENQITVVSHLLLAVDHISDGLRSTCAPASSVARDPNNLSRDSFPWRE
jgi:hypothetical protein